MKKTSLISIVCAAVAAVGVYSWTLVPAKAAAPKRVLLVTTTIGFRHAAIPIMEQVMRELSKSAVEFTVVSTSESPDYPAAEYQASVDQRNARIPLSQAKDNNMPPANSGGRGGLPGATPEQQAAVTEMTTAVAALSPAVTSANTALAAAIYSDKPTADLKAKVEAVTAAELAVANARLQAFARIQASAAKLSPEQVQSLVQSGGRGGAGGRGGGAPPVAAQPLTPAQQAAVTAMSGSLGSLNQAVTAARTALNGAPYADKQSPADLKAKADALGAAQLALANATAAAFARIQASSDRLSAEQAQALAQGGGAGRGGAGGGRGGAGGGPDPIAARVAKVLQQYLSPEALKNYDAVAFLNTTGELPIPDKEAFFKWIAEGHAFIGMHSAADTLHQTPEYLKMLGAEFSTHGAFHPAVPVINMDPKSPITAGWGPSITIDEEFYLFKNYDPKQVHVLLEMKEQPYTKEAGEYPVSWIKMYGKGRVFYTSLGHRDDVLLPDATIGDQEFKVRYNKAEVALAVQKHLLQGIRWSLGIVESDATPQVR